MTSDIKPISPTRAKRILNAVCRALSNHYDDLNKNKMLRFVRITVRLNLKTGQVESVGVTKDTEEELPPS